MPELWFVSLTIKSALPLRTQQTRQPLCEGLVFLIVDGHFDIALRSSRPRRPFSSTCTRASDSLTVCRCRRRRQNLCTGFIVRDAKNNDGGDPFVVAHVSDVCLVRDSAQTGVVVVEAFAISLRTLHEPQPVVHDVVQILEVALC